MRFRNALAVLLALSSCIAVGRSDDASNSSEPRRGIPKGVVVGYVRSRSKPEQSYALYLPSTYSDDRKWPIVYVFDPSANGTRPLKLMKDAAERYGYIVAASNNSQNGPVDAQLEAANAMFSDTHAYLAIDDHRVYFAGFSGGARVASYVAQTCNCSHAVFLNGAALMPGGPPLAQRKISAFSIVGRGDFNYEEMIDLDAKLEALGQVHFLRRFDGEHEWAPEPTWEEAFAWSSLLEMKDNLRPRDSVFVQTELTKSAERIKKQVESGEPSFALQEARALAAAFDGFADITNIKQQIALIEKDPATRNRVKQEKSELARQQTVTEEILSAIDSMKKAGDEVGAVAGIMTKVRQVRQDLSSKDGSTRRVSQRVLGSVFGMCMEKGGGILESGDNVNARPYLEIAAEARPDWAWAHLSLARCHAGRGDKKAALRELKRAMDAGFSIDALAAFVSKYPKLASLAGTEEYKRLAAPEARPVPAQ